MSKISLRDRGSDIRILANFFLEQIAFKKGRNFSFTEDVFQRMESYDWPGNIRELKAVVEYAATMSECDRIGVESLPRSLFFESSLSKKQKNFSEQFFLSNVNKPFMPAIIQKVEKNLIEMALKKAKTISEAINDLGISRGTFYKKLKQYNLKVPLKD